MTPINHQETDLNRYLVEQGLAFPTLYSSLSSQEIREFRQAAQTVRTNERLLWNHYQPAYGRLDLQLLYREENTHPELDPVTDTGAVIFPKLFR